MRSVPRDATKANPLLERLECRQLLSDTIFVDVNAPGPTHDGTSWKTAFVDLQQGLADAPSGSGDEIHVADGTYTPGPQPSTFQLKNGVKILGGYAGYGAVDPNARDVAAYLTILSGVTSGQTAGVITGSGTDATALIDGLTVRSNGFNGISMYNSGGSPTINNCTFDAGGGIKNNNSSPAISNCTFTLLDGEYTSGIANGNSSPMISNCTFYKCFGVRGGAMTNAGGSPQITNCTFIQNRAAHQGQVVYNWKSSVTFVDCDFSNNGKSSEDGGVFDNEGAALTLTRCTFTANTSGEGWGGVIYNRSSVPLTISDCTFTRNHGGYNGGAIYSPGAPVTLTSCVFQGNTSSGFAGAIYVSSADLVATNCVFVGNFADQHGGGALAVYSNTTTLTNCTFAGNVARETGGAIYLTNTTLNLHNSILTGDSAPRDGAEIYVVPSGSSTLNFDHSIVRVDQATNLPVLFVRDPSAGADGRWGTLDDDYGDLRLQFSSPGIDAGSNSAVPAEITTDVAGNPRFVDVPGINDPGAIVDIGAYERVVPFAVASFHLNDAKPAILIQFSGDILLSSLSASDLVLVNQTTGATIDCGSAATVSYSYRTARWIFSGALPDGNYHAVLPAGSVTDPQGNSAAAADVTLDFFVLAGDANQDRIVDANDLAVVSLHWASQTRNTFATGDFNFDGRVDVADLLIIANHWQKKLGPPAAPVSVPAAQPVTRLPPPARSPVARAVKSPSTVPKVLSPLSKPRASARRSLHSAKFHLSVVAPLSYSHLKRLHQSKKHLGSAELRASGDGGLRAQATDDAPVRRRTA